MSRAARWVLFVVVAAVFRLVVYPAFFENAALGFFPKEMATELKAGFADVSPDWKGFTKKLADASPEARKRMAAATVIKYGTRDELIEIYRFRATEFYRVAGNPRLNGLCRGIVADSTMREIQGFVPLVRISGRTLAREYMHQEAWEPPVDLGRDKAAVQMFLKYVTDWRQTNLAAFLKFPMGQSNRGTCLAMSELYNMAINKPDEPVGSFTLLDFVRALELLVLEDTSK